MSIDEIIASRLLMLRKSKGLSLEQLASLADVSKAMISKIERQESSPSATLLGKLASGLGVSVTQLLTEEMPGPKNLRLLTEQETWKDPDIGYLRRQVLPPEPQGGLEMIEITLPPNARVSYPSWGNSAYKQRLWLLEGTLQLNYGDDAYSMMTGDILTFGVDRAITFHNPSHEQARYLLVINQVNH